MKSQQLTLIEFDDAIYKLLLHKFPNNLNSEFMRRKKNLQNLSE